MDPRDEACNIQTRRHFLGRSATGIGTAVTHVQAVLSRSGVTGEVVHGANAAVGGPFPSSFLEEIAGFDGAVPEHQRW